MEAVSVLGAAIGRSTSRSAWCTCSRLHCQVERFSLRPAACVFALNLGIWAMRVLVVARSPVRRVGALMG